ncbi:MAG: hypothetical protein ACKV2V_13615 [Blastocatellia bacterium]
MILISGKIIPPPAGADVSTVAGLKNSIHLFEPKHFIFPFLAHAAGTLAGALVAAGIARNYKLQMALIVGCLFLAGGITNVFILPAPMWFNVVDLVGAYLPMSYIGWKIAARNK